MSAMYTIINKKICQNRCSEPFQSYGYVDTRSAWHQVQTIDGVMSLALRPKVMSQAPQHFRYSEAQPTCDDC